MIPTWFHSIAYQARRLRASTRGAVAVIGALSLTVLVGMGAFAVEATRGYAQDTTNQRVADMAALAGALAYNVNSSTSEMTATAKAVVTAQGLAASAATVALVTDAATSKQLVQVTVTTAVPLQLGRVFSSALSYDVTAVGSATTSTTTSASPPCLAALSSTPTYGITLDGGVTLNAAGCAIATNSGITVPWGTYITAKQATAGKSINNPGNGLTTSPTANNYTANKANAAADWMSTDTSLKSLLCQVNKLTGTTDNDYADGNTACIGELVTATAPGTDGDWDLNYSPAANVAAFRTGNNTYVVPGGVTRNIRNLNISGGMTVTFLGPVNMTVANLNMGGTALNIGGGNIVIGGKIEMNGGSLITVDVGVGNTVTLGQSGGVSINVGGGARICFTANCVAPTAAGGKFSAAGNIVTSGGSTIIFPKAAMHVINGDLSLNGSSTFGSGTYVIKGNFTNNTGGTMNGTDLTFALGGTFTLSGGTALDLSAPTASSSYGIPGVLIATKSSANTSIGGSSNNKYAGLFYAPKSNLTINGGGAMSSNGSACMMMIINTLTLAQGGGITTGACAGLSGGSSSTANVALFK